MKSVEKSCTLGNIELMISHLSAMKQSVIYSPTNATLRGTGFTIGLMDCIKIEGTNRDVICSEYGGLERPIVLPFMLF